MLMLPVKCLASCLICSCMFSRTVANAAWPSGLPGANGLLALPSVVHQPVPVGTPPALHCASSGLPKIADEIVPKMLLLFDGVMWYRSTYSAFTFTFTLVVGRITMLAEP